MIRRIDGVTPFEERSVDDATLPKGTRLLSQRGIPGFTVTRLRVVEDLALHQATRERSLDTYPPTTQVWRLGTGPSGAPSAELPKNDAHPEYVADEYMVATQGPGTEGFEVEKRAGRTGTYGWTAREGMMVVTP
jgi:hypothetical protein